MDYKIVIPARFGSSRLPGKPLLDIAGKPMIWHTYQRAVEAGVPTSNIVIATDHKGILDTVQEFGAQAVMTREDHESGTDRLAEVAALMSWPDDTVVVNVQGDEPLIPANLIEKTAQALSDRASAGMATLATPILNVDEVQDPNCVKVVCNRYGKALYFSRASVPFVRDGFPQTLASTASSSWFRHIGMYAYTVETLKKLTDEPVCEIESLEKLEQLRAMWLGIDIQVAIIDELPGHGVDTLQDLKRVQQMLEVSSAT